MARLFFMAILNKWRLMFFHSCRNLPKIRKNGASRTKIKYNKKLQALSFSHCHGEQTTVPNFVSQLEEAMAHSFEAQIFRFSLEPARSSIQQYSISPLFAFLARDLLCSAVRQVRSELSTLSLRRKLTCSNPKLSCPQKRGCRWSPPSVSHRKAALLVSWLTPVAADEYHVESYLPFSAIFSNIEV